LGLPNDKTYMKCFIANPPTPSNPDSPYNEIFSLSDSTTDRPR